MERLALKHAEDIRAQILAYLATEDPEVQYLLRLNAILLLTMKDGPSAIEIADLYGTWPVKRLPGGLPESTSPRYPTSPPYAIHPNPDVLPG